MHIRSLRIINYKSYSDSGTVNLGARWTVVVGRNNSGKIAILECFDIGRFSDKPHRSIANAREAALIPESQLHIELDVSGPEITNEILSTTSELNREIEVHRRSAAPSIL